MTREEAIKHFESYIGNECYTDYHQEACGMAISALRAQQIPVKLDRRRFDGCDLCISYDTQKPIDDMHGDPIVIHHGAITSYLGYREIYDYRDRKVLGDFKFCPFCGRPLTEDAWAELDWLQFGEKEPEGVLAILYLALWAMAELRERLFAYEGTMPLDRVQELAQAEKDGRLAMLPCKVGDTVYEANKRGLISTYKVISIHISECSLLIGWELMDGIYSNLNGFEVSALGKTVFLTREEAEAALKKREET